jgi:hypothetical protein
VSGQITDVERTDIVRSVSESCECSGNEILAAAETVAFALGGVLANRGTLVIQSAPKSAVVYIDGEKKGNTPVSVKVKPGQHKIIVAARDYRMEERNVTVAPAANMSINFQLKKEKRRFYQAWWFYAIVGVVTAGGVAAIVASSTGRGGGGGEKSPPPTGTVIIDSGSP